MDTLTGIVTAVTIISLLILLGVTWQRGRERRGNLEWLLAMIVFAMLACATYFAPEDTLTAEKFGRGFVLMLMLIGMFTTFGIFIIYDLIPDNEQRPTIIKGWLGLGIIWLIGVILSGIISDETIIGQSEWLVDVFEDPSIDIVITFAGIIIASGTFITIGLYQYYHANLPEIANRALYWILNATILALSLLLIGSGTNILAIIGMFTLLISIIATCYAYLVHRAFDIRGGMILALRTLSFVSVAAGLLFLTFYVVLSQDFDPSKPDDLIAIGAIALLVAALYVPIRQGIEILIKLIVLESQTDPAGATREFGQAVTEATELNQLVSVAIHTLNRVLGVQRSCLILLNNTFKVKDAVELLVMQPNGDQDKLNGFLSVYSPIYGRFAATRMPLSQYDIEYDPIYRDSAPQEHQFFNSISMSAYAPVILENSLIGILATGPMSNDTAYFPRDLALLATFAQQTGVALRNARLIDDMQHLNKSMQSLNKGLKAANEQLNKLDAVKSDFVTIASHELRTPLAQIRGYTDIIDALNEQGLLDQEQTTSMVFNLRKATERTEELIAAMLDVSQLDVNAMDLRLTDTPPETILRMAIEPLQEAISSRQLSLSARGLRGLPSVSADLQRLVQAFRNIIVNAIKFTPDGGHIEISAASQETNTPEDAEHILVEIKDTGVGIDQKNLDLIFRKFFRAYDPSLHSTGTYKFMGAGPGLGLTIAKGVIEGHGGKIWAESAGHNMDTLPGSTFSILLPISTPEDARRVMTIEDEDNQARKRPTAMKNNPSVKARPQVQEEDSV